MGATGSLQKSKNPALIILLSPCCWLCCPGQRICRRGTERPCYKVSYIQDSRRRLTFEDARQACRSDGGDLLSIETESEQRLMERFIKQLQAGDGDFWIGLRRSPHRYRAGTTSPACPSQYYWLDGSKAKFRSLSVFKSLLVWMFQLHLWKRYEGSQGDAALKTESGKRPSSVVTKERLLD